MSEDWTEAYRPKGLDEVLGNPKAVRDLKGWAEDWEKGNPSKKAAVLIGTPGTGKTSAALALAADYNWDVVEMNASDQRNADAIRSIALRGALGETFSNTGEYLSSKDGKLKLIVLDEADNISGREDRGGVPAMAELVRSTKQPVILIVNDWYALSRRSSALKNGTLQVKFARIKAPTVRNVLGNIARDRGIKISDNALEILAENSNGDLRSAIRDLQALAAGRTEINEKDTISMGFREVEQTMYSVMDDIFKRMDPAEARFRLRDVDESPDHKLLWIEENLPHAYRDHMDLYRGMKAISRADDFLSRVRRRQYYRFWAYTSDHLSFSVCAAKQKEIRGYIRYQFPMYLMKMSRSKASRALKNEISAKLGDMAHMSIKSAKQDLLPSFMLLFQRQEEFRLNMIIDMELEQEEIAFLLGAKVDSAKVKRAVADAKKLVNEHSSPKNNKIDVEKKAEPKSAPNQARLFSF
ncbi:MAG: replication factor C large subunit [Euryarchaeota archaeon]|nr:replication factor C large subunit [Euryarchaeota archaeon]